LETLYLLDANATETNAIRLKLLSASGELIEIVDRNYRPYFLTVPSLTEESRETVRYFNGETELTEKIELFSGEKKAFWKIYWPNSRIASKAATKLSPCWEEEIEFSRSYVYDKGLVFGAPHSEGGLELALDMPADARAQFERAFKEIESKDPLKYVQTLYWFFLLSQPIPALNLELLGVKESASEKVYAAWMLSRIANIPLAEAFSSRHVSNWIKAIVHTYLRKNNILIPTSEELRKGLPTHQVTGALTVAPKPGAYFNTVVCDFESLYPSCIDSFNLSYETVDCPHSECKGNKIPDVENHVCVKRRGFYSILAGALKELRIKVFKPLSKDKSVSEEKRRGADAAAKLLKLILVSSYGVTVRIHGVACPPLAEAITGYGRYVLRESWRLAEERGLRPLYGDTDSLFLDNASTDEVEWLISAVKERFRLDLAVDKRYSLCVLPKAKKAYFGILIDGTPDIKGVTAIKSNSPGYITNVFRECIKELSSVKNQEEYVQAKERIKKIFWRATTEIRNRQVKLEDLVYSVRLYFDPNDKTGETQATHQPYQCALQLMEAGKKLDRGEVVSFIKVKPFKHCDRTFTVKPAEFVKNLIEANVEDYIRNLLTALNQTFKPMGIELETERKTEISRWLSG
jgi:DNA polymerase elongation subunit (family B)